MFQQCLKLCWSLLFLLKCLVSKILPFSVKNVKIPLGKLPFTYERCSYQHWADGEASSIVCAGNWCHWRCPEIFCLMFCCHYMGRTIHTCCAITLSAQKMSQVPLRSSPDATTEFSPEKLSHSKVMAEIS